ncbi:MAG: bifunctional UDP-N-acetylglucosamine diphosphorylase/glucosamine-1-phosphate N-acetyltransferase GlmU [Deltaproteobacteria bacterium]|nr:bifunctional UDP-N-acetylglucosamine diphosphorylase/glucosamine-1-phosphate N-acetyltransferase GlmU [Deltaproteobacteria bacterium]
MDDAASKQLAVVILAAGQGTRMKSSRAKMLHELCGRSMLGHVMASARMLEPERLIVVVGRDAQQFEEAFAGQAEFVEQTEQKGTGHAVKQALPALEGFSGDVLILYGDTPLLTSDTFRRMAELKRELDADLMMLTAIGPIPGRVVRDAAGKIERVVEAQDATPRELEIEERNTGTYIMSADLLREGIASLKDDNRQGELYITDVVGYAVQNGLQVEGLLSDDAEECLGINTRADLARATEAMRRRINAGHMEAGVSFTDPTQAYIDINVVIGRDSLIEPGCVIQGDSVLGEGVHLKSQCVIESSRLDDGVVLGPMAHLRPNCHLKAGVKIGNFVEIKNSTLGEGTKSAHLSYIGDATIGAEVNFGCGTIVVNYDGIEKHHTVVEDGAFIGCNANLLSPVKVGKNAFVAAGTSVSKDVPDNALAVARVRQNNIEDWVSKREARSSKARKRDKGDD